MEHPSERYTIDHEAISNHADMVLIVEDLVAATSDPRWTQERACRPCLDWDAGKRVNAPRPPRAEDPKSSCSGCTWSYLDGVDTELLREDVRLDRLRTLEKTWARQLSKWRSNSLSMTWDAAKKRWIEGEDSSYRRWQAKKRELKACRRLIAELERKLSERLTPEGYEPRRRGWVRRMEFVANKPKQQTPI